MVEKRSKTVEMTAKGTVELHEQPTPELEEGAVLLRTAYSEVCGTDVHLRKGQLAGVPYPIIPGHVSTGTIEELCGDVWDIEGTQLHTGDPVTFLDVHETCNNCWHCLVAKNSTRCPQRKVYGITYSATEGLLGGWSQYIYLKPGVKIIKLQSASLMRTFMAGGCGLPTAIHAIQRSAINLGDTVAVQGAGPVGLMAAVLAKLRGAFHVIMVGAPEHRLQIAEAFGIETTINIMEADPASRVQQVVEATQGRGADVTIEATGVPSAVKEGLQMTRDGGTYTIVGQYTDAGDVTINPHTEINKKHLTIRGSWGSDFSHFFLAVKFIEKYATSYSFEKIISREYSLEEAEEALDDVEQLRILKAIIKP
ncbi:MAG: zinc-binding dehydrogenase [Candidatus Hodarchaeales archaeon]|jgi:L-iditol 2-dehydrogenase